MNIKSRNFTLVELVIILSIVIVVTTILIPIMMSIREKAKANSCLNNQRRCGYYISMAKGDLGKIINGEPQAAWALILSNNTFSNNVSGLGYFKTSESNFLRCIRNKSLQKRNISNLEKLRNTYGMQGPDNISHAFWTATIDQSFINPTTKTINNGYKHTSNGALYIEKFSEPENTMLTMDSKFVSPNTEIMFDNNKSEYLIRYQNSDEYMHSEQKGVPYLAHQDSTNILFSDMHATTVNQTKLKKIYYKKNNICVNQQGAMDSIKNGLKLYETFIDNDSNKSSIINLNEL